MPLVQTRGAASAQGFGEFAQASVPNYIEEVFSTYLYTGNGSTQTITNGIDTSTYGGLVWLKDRSSGQSHALSDTARGVGTSKQLRSNTTGAATTDTFTGFTTSGFTLDASFGAGAQNLSAVTYASWTFREQPKFFDVVTWTGNGTNPRQISHNLGSVPGCIIVKSTTRAENWTVYHQSLGNTGRLALNTTAAAVTGTGIWASTTPTSTVFTVSADNLVNFSGDGYVAYLFAHDAGGFGLTGTDNVISCGSYTGSSNTPQQITLGYEPQWVLLKKSSTTDDWYLFDNMRGMALTLGNNVYLNPNLSASETASSNWVLPNATGFVAGSSATDSATYIYIAIRRGPMKVPTLGTSVFAPVTQNTGTTPLVTTNFPVDLAIGTDRTGANRSVVDRLRGTSAASSQRLFTNLTNAEAASGGGLDFANNTGFTDSLLGGANIIFWSFQRAPGCFDEVCYTGNGGSNRQISHNLTSVPELLIVKSRSRVQDWRVLSTALSQNSRLNGTNAFQTINTELYFGDDTSYIAPTSSVFTIGSSGDVNANNGTYVAYLFATCAGVSKVFSYTGNGSSQTINCGFTAGSRFVLIKRTDAAGDWYVWDSARGIVAGNDPHLSLNTTAAEVTTDDSVDTDNTGFIVNQVAATNVNVSSATYIGLAVA
jgi:hypothetical protein